MVRVAKQPNISPKKTASVQPKVQNHSIPQYLQAQKPAQERPTPSETIPAGDEVLDDDVKVNPSPMAKQDVVNHSVPTSGGSKSEESVLVHASRDMGDVIPGSDESDGGDISSGDELFRTLGSFSSATSTAKPTAKRTSQPAITVPSVTRPPSARVLRRNPRNKRTDLGALFHDAEQDQQTEAHLSRLSSLQQVDQEREESALRVTSNNAKLLRLRDVVIAPLSAENGDTTPQPTGHPAKRIANDETDISHSNKFNKVVRAIERTHVTSSRKAFLFFPKSSTPPTPLSTLIPFKTLQLVLKSSPIDRPEDVNPELLEIVAIKAGHLPEDIVRWMWKELVSPDPAVRRPFRQNAFLRVLVRCAKTLGGILTREEASATFLAMSATRDAFRLGRELPLVPESNDMGDPMDRPWSDSLQHIFKLIPHFSPYLDMDMILFWGEVLLRLGTDSRVTSEPSLLLLFRDALISILGVAHDKWDPSTWDQYCHSLCDSHATSFPQPHMRLHVLRFLPVRDRIARDLVRRFAFAFFMEDTSLAQSAAPFHMDNIHDSILQRIRNHPLLQTNRETDYIEFSAVINIFNLAFGQGLLAEQDGDSIDQPAFDSVIDDIVTILREKFRSIQDSGLQSLYPTEAKGDLEGIINRLLYNVRTRPPSVISIYDIDAQHTKTTHTKQRTVDSFLTRHTAEQRN